jgi:hypothetical protein
MIAALFDIVENASKRRMRRGEIERSSIARPSLSRLVRNAEIRFGLANAEMA